MTEIVMGTKPLSVSPLKVGQPIGAVLALLGLARTMPLEHGARGCASFDKLFFMRHFREPIAMQTTAMDQLSTVMGADDAVVQALATIARRHAPDVVGLVSTSLSETQGADIPRTLALFRRTHPEFDAMAVVPVSASDPSGCLESGYALAVDSLLTLLGPRQPSVVRRPRQVTVLASAMLAPGDVEILKEWIEAFGLSALVVPDLADSLDGHLIEEGYSPLTYGGTTRASVAALGESMATLVIGPSLYKAADGLRERTGVPDFRFPGLVGMEACDAFSQTLCDLSGRPMPARLARQRAQLADALVDCQFQVGGARAAVAADPDLLVALSAFLDSIGVDVGVAVTSARGPALAETRLERVVVGDLEDLERLAREDGAELIATNSHGAELARRLGCPLLRAGFPLYDVYGAASLPSIGYPGTRRVLFEIANLLHAHYRERPPYRSRFWAGTARENETRRNGAC
ncbi:nitrogenase iron-molybdenum cofactor biosynthesis protein NifN [Pararhodospirillum oryzae]|uniref:Nitrogenase iron-molybdenum cofactor biosynthesis protein NifN n=1 Tax=Pararhodospirillum oryzae TaxID=478448 RepID=A0A512H6G7_9PROT|nr:nitrogenase iron-molybdenum cofactor biosynthesis protein NifN [Pararhodospirillum oryzae]GEO81031.1 nitrogenase iron-molybdenum cofactor biosynthesis protein NifN [Pararhodospirillum oryzae]